MKKNKESLDIHIPVTYLGSTWKGNFEKLPANKTYELIIDYPLENPAKFKIKTGRSGMNLITLLGKIGELYQETYDKEDATGCYKIYGHDIDDLNLGGIDIDHKKRTIKLGVDS